MSELEKIRHLLEKALQQTMSQLEKIREGVFEWKIHDFMENAYQSKESEIFQFGSVKAYLYMHDLFMSDSSICMTETHCTFANFLSLNIVTGRFLSNTLFKICLMNRYGHECLSLKGTVDILTCLPFCLPHSYLRKNAEDLLPGGTLTIRLFCHLKDKKHGSNTEAVSNLSPGSSSSSSINVCSIQTETLSTKDNYSNTGSSSSSSINVCSIQTETLSTKDNYSNTEKEPTKLLETLSKDFGCFYNSKTDTDCVLRVGETQFPVHRQVLVARSEVFAAMFRHDTSENRSGVVDILDVNAAVLGDVLYYIYSGHIRGLSTDTTVPMYTVADKYALIELRDICLDFLMHNLTMENVCDAAILSHSNGEMGLEEKVVQFIQAELNELVETENWKQFLSTKSVLASRLLCSALMTSREEIKKLTTK